MQEEKKEGEILLVDKPYGWSSFQLVKKIKWLVKAKKAGHAGTLDPLATGLMIICTESSTKKINDIQVTEKEYTGTITLGATTPSYDLETEVNERFETAHINDEMIYETAGSFIGESSQIPPVFSAIKVEGKRSYKLARQGEAKELKSRLIQISEFEITRIAMPEIDFRVVCSKGTYIRTIAFDFGKKLNSGGHLTKLCRTRIGEFKLDNALQISDFEKRKISIETTAHPQ